MQNGILKVVASVAGALISRIHFGSSAAFIIPDYQITSSSVGAVAVSESDPDIIFIGTGETCIRGNIMPGVRSHYWWDGKVCHDDEYMLVMSEEPHHAGSPGARRVAEYALDKFRSWGLDAEIEEFEELIGVQPNQAEPQMYR